MARTFRQTADDDDFEIVDGVKILRDRRSLRVPLHLMDATQRDVRRGGAAVVDATRQPTFDARRHRPGFRTADNIDNTLRQKAYDSYQNYIENAWRADATGEMQGPKPGDPCTVRSGAGKFGPEGSRGTMQMINGVLTCVAAPPMRGDARDGGQQTHAQRMQDEYSRYDFEISRRFLDGRKTRRNRSAGQRTRRMGD
jgi:hypothetical protein